MPRYTVEIYRDAQGKEPYSEWFYRLRDARTRARIRNRIARIEALGNFGDCVPVGDGVYELRFFFGSGYRVYFGKTGQTVIILICGGDKGSQKKDIKKARQIWTMYQGKTP